MDCEATHLAQTIPEQKNNAFSVTDIMKSDCFNQLKNIDFIRWIIGNDLFLTYTYLDSKCCESLISLNICNRKFNEGYDHDGFYDNDERRLLSDSILAKLIPMCKNIEESIHHR